MKNSTFLSRCLMLALILLVPIIAAKAQTYLTDAYQPTDSYLYDAYPTKGSGNLKIAVYNYKGGFSLRSGKGGLISGDKTGFAEFSLKGAYEKMSFVVGPGGKYSPNSSGDASNVVLTVRGDGEILLDEVIWCHDAPKEYTIDIAGVDQLRFDLPQGETDLGLGAVKLWKAGEKPTPTRKPLENVHNGNKILLVEQLFPHYIRHSGWVDAIIDKDVEVCNHVKSISVNRVTYTTGLQFTANQALSGNNKAWAYFWLQKKYDKVSFIVGPRDNQSSNASGWLTVKGDGKILYEKRITQKDLAEQVVIDVKGIENLSFHSIDEASELNGGIVFGVVDIFAYPQGDFDIPQAGMANGSKERLSQLPNPCRMCSNIKPFSVRGVSSNKDTYFDGATKHRTFSMGGEKFWEGFILTTGTTLFDDNINSYATFDLAGEFDYVTFTAGCLTQHRVLDDDIIRVYADDHLILETVIHATWPNQYFELPLNKCRTLRFEKPGNGESKQVYFGIGDVVLYRDKIVPHNLFVHDKPECPETADLIDLCQRPYFHFVGRYLSSLTNFDFNDCFKNGTSQKEYFQMKDGTKIYKGIMLETNIPLGFEDMTITKAICLMFTPTYVAGIDLAVTDDKGHQSSCAAFNPYREYETCTFTVANKSEYIDPFDSQIGGKKQAPPVTLYVIADQHQVAEITLTDKMQPTTYTVPINHCEQLMFWLQCGDVRSGQYVLYDMTLSKKPYEPPTQVNSPSKKNEGTSATPDKKKKKDKQEKQEKKEEIVAWEMPKRSGNKYIDDYLKDCDAVWKATKEYEKRKGTPYSLSTTYLQGDEGKVYKAVSFVDSRGQRLSINALIAENEKTISEGKSAKSSMSLMGLEKANASLALPELGFDAITYGKIIGQANKMVSQCEKSVDEVIAEKTAQNDALRAMQGKALVVGQKASTNKVLLLHLDENETAPEGVLQQVRYFNMD